VSRFYLLRLTPPKPKQVIPKQTPGAPLQVSVTVSNNTPKEWTSHPNGVYDPGAHNIIFDVLVLDYSVYAGASTISIEGPRLSDLSEPDDYSPKDPNDADQYWGLELYGGMAEPGLPLSTSAAGQPKPGLLASAQVLQSFGNWTGTDMRISFLLAPSTYSQAYPGNLVLNWLPGQPISQALTNMFNVAYPGIPVVMQVSPNLVAPAHGYHHMSRTLRGMAQAILEQTSGTSMGMPKGYRGVHIYMQAGKIICTDYTQPPKNVTQLSFDSLIGQPVWVGPQTISIQTVLRADIQMGAIIEMPKGPANHPSINLPGLVTTPADMAQFGQSNSLAFTGKFVVTSVRHIGESRGTSGQDWMTIIEAIAHV